MKWMLKYLKPLRLRLTIGISIKFVATTVELLIPFLLSYILENVIVTNDVGNILFFGSLMAICALATCIGNITANRMAAKTAMLFSRRMRRDLFEKTLNLSAKSTDKFTIPSLEARITSDTYNVQNFVTIMQKMGIRAPILLIGGTAITMIMDVKLALVMLATLPLIFVIIYSISRMGIPLYSKVHHSVDGMIRIVREDAQGIRVIKALSKIDYENARFDKANKALKKSETRAGVIMGVANPIMTLLMNMGIVAVIAVSAHFVFKGFFVFFVLATLTLGAFCVTTALLVGFVRLRFGNFKGFAEITRHGHTVSADVFTGVCQIIHIPAIRVDLDPILLAILVEFVSIDLRRYVFMP